MESFYNKCKSGTIYSLLAILNYSDALSEFNLKKAYTVYILEKYIPLLQFTKYIMLRLLLKYVWKGFEGFETLCNLQDFTLNIMLKNSPESFHPTSDVMTDL